MPRVKKREKNWPIKAYKNLDFLTSPSARLIRILSELMEPQVRFRKYNIRNTVVFFGSARALPGPEARRELRAVEKKIKGKKKTTPALRRELHMARQSVKMSGYYDDAVEMSEKLTRWFKEVEKKGPRFVVCSGGGPGIMEGVNRGAQKAKGRSIGLNISLPMEQEPNVFITRDLSFDFHYFFVRKFWFFYLAKSIVIFPGGYGTMDEFFELLTLVQTGKSMKKMSIILYGGDYWKSIVNFEAMIEWGTIEMKDLDLFKIFDDVDETVDYIKQQLSEDYIK